MFKSIKRVSTTYVYLGARYNTNEKFYSPVSRAKQGMWKKETFVTFMFDVLNNLNSWKITTWIDNMLIRNIV